MQTFLKGLAALGIGMCVVSGAQAAEEGETPHYPLKKPVPQEWSFSGPFGTYDKGQL